jgi:hypothetical protein
MGLVELLLYNLIRTMWSNSKENEHIVVPEKTKIQFSLYED